MILERVEITVKDGMVEPLLAALRDKALPLLLGIQGCLAARAGGGVENPGKVILLVDWVSLQAHEAFKTLPEYVTLATAIFPFAVTATAEHFAMG
jgi:Antibiotic biosynthesis monooxygenase